MRELKQLPFHPIILCIYPFISFYSHNLEEMFPFGNPSIRLLLVLFVASAFLLTMLSTLIFRNSCRGGIVSTGIVLVFFSYGHIDKHISKLVEAFFEPICLFTAGVIFIISLLFLIIVRMKDVSRATIFLNFLALLLILLPTMRIIVFRITEKTPQLPKASSPFFSGRLTEPARNIYYIILDGYAGGESLKEFYGYSNSEFLRFLKARGFIVLDRAVSNYAVTHLSLASSLNMLYPGPIDNKHNADNPGHRIPVGYLIRHNKVMRFLNEHGYLTYNVSSYWNITNHIDAADYNISKLAHPDHLLEINNHTNLGKRLTLEYFNRNEVTRTFLGSTLLGPFLNMHPKIKQEDYFKPFRIIESISHVSGPKMVFAHIIGPHPPYIVDAKCNSLPNPEGGFYGTSWHKKEMYLAQLTCINQQVKELVEILLDSEPLSSKPIIIIQADHGPASLTADIQDTGPATNASWQGIKERMSILHALHLPGVNPSDIPSNLTPINTFRFIFNHYFGTEFELLPNKSFFSTYEKAGNMIDVTLTQTH